MLEILFTEGHPETSLLDGRVVLYQRLQLLMVEQIALAGTDIGVGEWFVDFQRFCLNPLPVFIVKSLLGNLADIDFGIEVCGEGMMMVTCITIDNVEIVDLVEVMLSGVGGIDTTDPRIESAAKDSRKASLFETVLVGPLPTVFEMSLVFWLIVGSVEIVTATCQTSIHNRQVLIGQSEVDDQFWLIA